MTDFLTNGILLEEDHRRPPRSLPGWVFLWVRHPMHRFISAFNHSKAILDFDIFGLDPNNLSIENCPSPARIYSRIKQGFAFSQEYDLMIRNFESVNSLAESFSSSNSQLIAHAEALFARPEGHISKGIGFHLSNGRWVERHSRRILMVGCLESMTQDFHQLVNLLGLENLSGAIPSHRRKSSKKNDSQLSIRARRNLANLFRQTEYPALEALATYGHLSKDRVEFYLT